MNRLLLLLLLLFCCHCASWSQPNQLFIKKGVFKKKAFSEGERIHLLLQDGQEKKGIITNLHDSVIYINGQEIAIRQINTIFIDGIRKNKLPDLETMLWIGAGVSLTTIGLSLNNANDPKTALTAGLAIGYGPVLLKFLFGRLIYAFHKKKYRMGRKYHLQVFDIRVPRKQSF
jgi:hypothetical protein